MPAGASVHTRREIEPSKLAGIFAHMVHQAIVQYAEAMNMPRRWIWGVQVKVARGHVSVYNNWAKPASKWGPPVPLGDIFENGSSDHDIVVRFAKSLHWKSFEVVERSSSPGWKVASEDNFSKRVHVRGIRGLRPMKRGWRLGRRRFEDWVKSKKTFEEWKAEFRPNMSYFEARVTQSGWKFPRNAHWWREEWSRKYSANRAALLNAGIEGPMSWEQAQDYRIDAIMRSGAGGGEMYRKGDLW